MNAKARCHKKRNRGQSLVELCAALAIGVPLVLAAVDMGFIALGATINDNICKDAARAAASGPPASLAPERNFKVPPNSSPYQRVVAVIKKLEPSNFPVKVYDTAEIIETVEEIPPPEMGGAIDGDIDVATTARISPPFILRAFVPTGVELRARHVVPYTYVMLPPKKAP